MDQWGIIGGYFTALVSISALALYARWSRCRDCHGMLSAAGILWATWAVSMALWFANAPDDADSWVFSVMDVSAGFAVMLLWKHEQRTWKLALALCFLTELGIHSALGLLGHRRYILLQNITFALEIACVFLPGALHVARSVFLDLLLPVVFGDRPHREVRR